MNYAKAHLIVSLKESGKTTSEIADYLGVCRARAHEVIRCATYRVDTDKEGAPRLSARALNGLRCYFGRWPSASDVAKTPDSALLKTKNFGRKTLKEVREWAPFGDY